MAGHYQVSVAFPSAEEAGTVARMAVERRLAACAQVCGPVRSTYWWEGSVRTAEEWLCVLKTAAERVAPLTDAVLAAHSYDVPEVIATPIEGGNAAYLAWVLAETGSRPPIEPG